MQPQSASAVKRAVARTPEEAAEAVRAVLAGACHSLTALVRSDPSMCELILPAVRKVVQEQKRLAANRQLLAQHPLFASQGAPDRELVAAQSSLGNTLKRKRPLVERIIGQRRSRVKRGKENAPPGARDLLPLPTRRRTRLTRKTVKEQLAGKGV